MFKYLALILVVSSVTIAQRNKPNYQSATTPVPILRQINSHNQDGSYTYGYEGADGSYKIETKATTGEVKGKYGYYDDAGQLREIEYGATRDGFNPTGTGINVPPPAPVNRVYNPTTGVDYDDDGQYRPDQHEYPYQYVPESQNAIQPARPSSRGLNFPRRQQQQRQQQVVQDNTYYQPEEYVQPAPQARQQPIYRPAPVAVNPADFYGHPARNIDLNSGSYSINYSG